MDKRTVFYISDGTGITVVGLGRSLLSQFQHQKFETHTLPYIDSPDKAERLIEQINAKAAQQPLPPLVIYTLASPELRRLFDHCQGICFDVLAAFLDPLANALNQQPVNLPGRSRDNDQHDQFRLRSEAVNYALEYDDGGSTCGYEQADIILTGVSRTGKTPTCLYLALQFGIRAANYPLTPEDLESDRLPHSLQPYRHKLIGLTTSAGSLSAIRQQRRPDSRYASYKQCQFELGQALALFQLSRVPHLDVSDQSVEEVATQIIEQAGLRRQFK